MQISIASIWQTEICMTMERPNIKNIANMEKLNSDESGQELREDMSKENLIILIQNPNTVCNSQIRCLPQVFRVLKHREGPVFSPQWIQSSSRKPLMNSVRLRSWTCHVDLHPILFNLILQSQWRKETGKCQIQYPQPLRLADLLPAQSSSSQNLFASNSDNYGSCLPPLSQSHININRYTG